VSFWAMSQYQGQAIKLVFKGQVLESEIHFTMGLDDGSWSTTSWLRRRCKGKRSLTVAARNSPYKLQIQRFNWQFVPARPAPCVYSSQAQFSHSEGEQHGMHKPIKYAEKALTYAAGGAWFVFDKLNQIHQNPGFRAEVVG